MKIFIDAGYYSNEVTNGLKEGEVTLNVGQRLVNHLKSGGFETELQQLDSVEKVYTASNNWGADLFISLNCNIANPKAVGTETFYCQGSSKGQALAQAIQSQIIAKLGTVDRGIKDDTQSAAGSLGVLRKTACPAALVELAFISNVNDAQLLRDRQEDFASAIAQGIMNYCGVNVNVSSASTVATPTQEPEVALSSRLNINFDTVASLSRKYESNNDLEALSNEANDTRYGLYGLSSSKKTINAFVDWLSNHSDTAFANYGKSLADDGINSEKFIEEWKNLTTVDPGNFGKLQDEFVKTMYFDKAVDALAKEKFHLDKHSDAMQAVVFARAVQDGVDNCITTFKKACTQLNQPNLSYIDDKYFDEKLINAVYDTLLKDRASETRLSNERSEAVSMLNGGGNSF